MDNLTKNFLDKFYSLPGITIGEKYRSLHRLLKENNDIDQVDFAVLKPKNCLEEIFKLEIAIYFRKVPSILDVLKSDNPVLINRLLKLSLPLLNDVFQNIDGSELVHELFLHLSLITKLKLLNRLARCLTDSQKSDEYFDAIFEKYGFHLASKLIPSCSPKKILDILKNYRVEITSAQLLFIVKKHPDFGEQIFELLGNRKSKLSVGQKYNQVFVFLAKTNFVLFAKLNKKYNPDLKLGRKTTKLCIFSGKKEVIQNSLHYFRFLHKKEVVRRLQDQEFDQYYLHLFPKSINEYKKEAEVFLNLLQYLPIEKKVGKLLTSFKHNFGEELWNFDDLVNFTLLQAMSPNNRELWMEKYSKPKKIQEEQWASLMKIDKSIPLLTNKIGLTSNVKLRSQIIPYFVITCKINNDKKALAEVCKYVTMKHHNDHWRVRQGFLNGMLKHFDLSVLEEDHWKYINELLQFNYVNNENYYQIADFLAAYINFLMSRNLPIDDQLKRWFKLELNTLKMTNPEYKEVFWKYYLEMYLNREIDDNCYYYYSLPSGWSKIYFRDKKYSSEILHFLKTYVANCYIWGIERCMVEWFNFCAQRVERIEILNLIFNSKNHLRYPIILKWLLVNDPLYIIDNLEILVKPLLCARPSLISYCKQFHHLELPQKLCPFLKKELINHKPNGNYRNTGEHLTIYNLMNALVILMDTKDFLDFIKTYKTTISKIDVSSEEGVQLARMQKCIAICLKKLNPPFCALDDILRFSQGDFLNLVQNSLIFVTRNVAEIKLLQFLQKLEAGSVAMRKTSIYLQFELSSNEDIFAMEQRFKNHGTYSISKALLKGTLNFFVNNPNERTWELLKGHTKFVNLSDEEAFSALIKWEKIPIFYLSKYLDFMWNFLKSFTVKKETENKKFEILDAISSNDSVLPNLNEFSQAIILEYFGSPDCHEKLQTFTHQYIILENCNSDHKNRLEFVFQVLQKYVRSAWYNCETCEFSRNCLFNFVENFCLIFFENKCTNISIFDDFLTFWNKTFGAFDLFDEFLYLKFTSFYLKDNAIPVVAQQMTTFLEDLYEKNGVLIFESYWKILNLFLNRSCEANSDQMRFDLIECVQNGNSDYKFLLVIFFLPNYDPVMLKYKEVLRNILNDLLRQENNYVVKIYLTKYLKSKNKREECEEN